MGDDVYEDLEEEDVWAVMRERKKRSPKEKRAGEPTASPAPQRLPTPASTIPTSAAHTDANGVASSAGGGHGGRVFQQSAPVNVPDWSKIHGKSGSSEGNSYGGATCSGYGHDDREGTSALCVGNEKDDEEGMLPPHEWIARKLARSQISSFSVCEGVGRTLKGRDLSRVRNAVLSRTGFLE